MATCTALAHCGLKKHGNNTGAFGDLSARVKLDSKKAYVDKVSSNIRPRQLNAK